MAHIKLDYNRPLKDGISVSFKAPCDCAAVDGLCVYYDNGGRLASKVFTFRDTHGNDLTSLGNLFFEGAYVRALLDIVNGYAYIENADTNGYLEGTFGAKQNKLGWATDEDIDAMFDGTYEGVENEDPEGDGYLPGDGPADAVTYTPQKLTEEQKAQARKNIGAASLSDISDAGPDRHVRFFAITEDGVLSLKPEYRGKSNEEQCPASISDNGVGKEGSKVYELPDTLYIPEIVGGIEVKQLSEGMFCRNLAIKNVVLPSSVNTIPAYCFFLCIYLENVHNTEHITGVGDQAFAYSESLKQISFPNLKMFDGASQFMWSYNLEYANIGSAASIPEYAFAQCTSLKKVESKKLVTQVGKGAFFRSGLEEADFLENVTQIGEVAFIYTPLDYDWSSLENCEFGDNATSLQFSPDTFGSDCVYMPCTNPLPTQLSQYDPRWMTRYIGNTETSKLIYGNGCSLFSSVHAYCGAKNIAFEEIEEFEGYVNTCMNHDPTCWENFGNVAYGHTIEERFEPLGVEVMECNVVNKSSLQMLYNALAEGKYAWLGITKDSDSSYEHAACIYGVDKNGNLKVIDSERGSYIDTSIPMKYLVPYRHMKDSKVPGSRAFAIFSEPCKDLYTTIEDALSETNKVPKGTTEKVGAYTDRFGKYHVVLLNDIESSSSIAIARDCTLHLNGRTIRFTSAGAQLNINTAKTVTIDGTTVKTDANGTVCQSTIVKQDISSDASEKLIHVNGTNLVIYGGIYSITNVAATNVAAIEAESDVASALKLNNCTITCNGLGNATSYGVNAQAPVTLTADYCLFDVDGETGKTYGVYAYDDCTVTNSAINCSTGGLFSAGAWCRGTATTIANSTVTVENGDAIAYGLSLQDTAATITDCTVTATGTKTCKSISTTGTTTTVTLNGNNTFNPTYVQ